MLFTLSATLSSADFLSWGWRVAFWLSAVIVFVGYYIRTHVTEAPIFLEAKALVEKYFGTIARGADVPRRIVPAPPLTKEQRVSLTDSRASAA